MPYPTSGTNPALFKNLFNQATNHLQLQRPTFIGLYEHWLRNLITDVDTYGDVSHMVHHKHDDVDDVVVIVMMIVAVAAVVAVVVVPLLAQAHYWFS